MAIRQIFPKAQFNIIQNAAHWLHAEKPVEFTDIAISFLR
jgi:pimeloyl-ACP methyl ester carboxylesterase